MNLCPLPVPAPVAGRFPFTLIALAALAWCAGPGSARAQIIEPGLDLFTTPPGGVAAIDFGTNPIPANFFGPGSEPFTNFIVLRGMPIQSQPSLGAVDTIVRRLAPVSLDGPRPETVPVELVALSLTSVAPFTVTYSDGSTQRWRLQTALPDAMPLPAGEMSITSEPLGRSGEFFATLVVRPKLTFLPFQSDQPRTLHWGRQPDNAPLRLSLAGRWCSVARQGFTPRTAALGLLVNHDANGMTPMLGPLPGTTPNFLAGVRRDSIQTADGARTDLIRARLVAGEARGLTTGLLTSGQGIGTTDADQDGISDYYDNCPYLANPLQADADKDGVGDACDNCPQLANPGQEDRDANGTGDLCESLAIRRVGPGVILSWPAGNAAPALVQQSDSIVRPQWTPVLVPPVLANGRWEVNVPAEDGAKFFKKDAEGCECQDLALVGLDNIGVLFSPALDTNKTWMSFDCRAYVKIHCPEAPEGVCQGNVKWSVDAGAGWNGVPVVSDEYHSLDTYEVIKACDSGEAAPYGTQFRYEALIHQVPPIQVTLRVRLELECSGAKQTYLLAFRLDTTAWQGSGIDLDNSDMDGDGLSGAQEAAQHTSDRTPDTDGDGRPDGTDPNPLDPTS